MSRAPKRTSCKVCDGPLDGAHKVYCKACWAEYNRARRAEKPEEHRAAVKKFRDANPGYDAEWLRARYAKDPEFWNRYHQEWREAHPDLDQALQAHHQSQAAIRTLDRRVRGDERSTVQPLPDLFLRDGAHG